jgi:hypothetical protein
MSSRRRAKVTIRPSRLTAGAIPRTLGTPNFCLKIGRRETPKVAPSLATPAANPPVVPRNCVGDNIGASVTVVELGPAFISKLKRMNSTKTNGLCKREFVRPTVANSINMPTAIPAKPMACIRMRPNRGIIQTPSLRAIEISERTRGLAARDFALAEGCGKTKIASLRSDD